MNLGDRASSEGKSYWNFSNGAVMITVYEYSVTN